jgi:hypothetical protein
VTGTGNSTLRTTSPNFVTFDIASPVALRSISFQVTVAGEAGNLIKVWLLETGTHGSVPDTLLHDFGSVVGDVTNSGLQITPATPIALTPGWYAFIIGDTATTTHAQVLGNGQAYPETFPGRTSAPLMTRIDLWTRGGTSAEGITVAGAAPTTYDWTTSGSVRTNNISGGRNPLFLLDLIPTA